MTFLFELKRIERYGNQSEMVDFFVCKKHPLNKKRMVFKLEIEKKKCGLYFSVSTKDQTRRKIVIDYSPKDIVVRIYDYIL